jgi:trehalose/maltose transport system substrate-binding protein
MAAGWVNTISPGGVLSYTEEESRGVWQTGNAVFMRNWPYAYALGNGADSPIKGKFDVAPLPSGGGDTTSAATLGGWNLAVSKYSPNAEVATDLVLYMTGAEFQKGNAIKASHLPTIQSLYDDKDIAEAQPLIPRWKEIFLNAVPRPSAAAKVKYNEVSNKFWTAAHEVLGGSSTPQDSLELLEVDLDDLKGGGW